MRLASSRGDARDLALAGQKDEDRSRLLGERSKRRAHDLVLDARRRIAPEIARLDGKASPLAFDQRGLAHQSRHARAVERRRHHQQAQILA